MTKEELIQEIEKQKEMLEYLEYKRQVMDLSSDIDLLMAFVQVKDEKIKELEHKLEEIKGIIESRK